MPRERLSAHALTRIRALLAEGLPPLLISERLGVAVQTVYNVRDGRVRMPKRKAKKLKPDLLGIRYFDPMGEPVWCDVCKAMVLPPCLACQVRARKERCRNANP